MLRKKLVSFAKPLSIPKKPQGSINVSINIAIYAISIIIKLAINTWYVQIMNVAAYLGKNYLIKNVYKKTKNIPKINFLFL